MEKKLNKKEHSKNSSCVIAMVGAVLILIGGFFLFYNYIETKKALAFDYVENAFVKEETKGQPEKEKIKEEEPDPLDAIAPDDYIGYLIIPKINLKKGFTRKESIENDVEKNIYLVEGSNYPDQESGNLIIAGHSGSGWKAFFNDLQKLNTNDVAYVTYKNKKYTYKIVNIYKQAKTGKIAIYRNYDKTTLTLITCTNNDSTTQTIYIAELESITKE